MAPAAPDCGTTSSSLLVRIRRQDGAAWDRFANLSTPLIYAWARRCGLTDSDAADVVQEVCCRVISRIGEFGQGSGQGSFRGWLWAITRNQIRLHFRRLKKLPRAQGGSEVVMWMEQHAAAVEQDAEPSTPEDSQSLVHRALRLIRDDFQETTWQAFWRLAIEGDSAAEIAADLRISVSAVRQAKYRILCRLRQELLVELWVDQCPITDSGLDALHRMTTLRHLFVPRTTVTREGARRFRGSTDRTGQSRHCPGQVQRGF